jgi:hypothetical protein
VVKKRGTSAEEYGVRGRRGDGRINRKGPAIRATVGPALACPPNW